MSFSGKQDNVESRMIGNQPFWPALDLAELINQYRTPSDLPDATVETHLRLAMVLVNDRLKGYRQQMRDEGYDNLTEIPAETVGDVSIQCELYRRAVFCQAKSSILRDWPTIDRRDAAENQARTGEETEDRYQDYAGQAIRQLLGLGQINVEAL